MKAIQNDPSVSTTIFAKMVYKPVCEQCLKRFTSNEMIDCIWNQPIIHPANYYIRITEETTITYVCGRCKKQFVQGVESTVMMEPHYE